MFFEITERLGLNDAANIIQQKLKLKLSADAANRISRCRLYLNQKMAQPNAVYYGINTGFGSLCNTQISESELSQLQENLLLSHACGVGQHVPQEIVRLMLLLKVQSLSYGNSGVQLETVERLIDFYNVGITPVVYELGSLGASGDLAPLAHLCLPLLGLGEVWFEENNHWIKKPAAEVLKLHGLKPIKLQSKEGLALINGTQFMLAYGLYNILQAQKLYKVANYIAAVSVDAFDAKLEPYSAQLHAVRPHKGQVETAKQMRELLNGSQIAAQPKTQVQDPYAFRCIPQVHGASYDTIQYVASVFETEMNSVTDNPNIFVEEDLILSGGNFHGQPLALVLDFLAIALAELGSISERRTYQLIGGLRNLPVYLAPNPGLNSGMMIPQYAAASIVSQNKQLCTPASVDSIVSSNGQEDHVSMGANAATKCYKVVNNLCSILSIELLNAAQAIEFRLPLQTSITLQNFLKGYREKVKFNTTDRALYVDIAAGVEFIQSV